MFDLDTVLANEKKSGNSFLFKETLLIYFKGGITERCGGRKTGQKEKTKRREGFARRDRVYERFFTH